MKFFLYFITYSISSFSLFAQVVSYSDAFHRDTKLGVFKGRIALPAKSKSFLDKEENRIQATKRLVILQMLSYHRYNRKRAMDPRLEEMIVMESPEYLLKNFKMTDVKITNFPKNHWNSFAYIYRSFDYRCEYDEYRFDNHLVPYYDSKKNYYRNYIHDELSEKERKNLDKDLLERKEIGFLFTNGESFIESMIEPKLKKTTKLYSSEYKCL